MERGRILVLGQTKEHTYEVRNLLDNKKFELELALSVDIAKLVLTQRYMNLLAIHTEVDAETAKDFFAFCLDRGVDLPLLIFGEEPEQFVELIPYWMQVWQFPKPYAADDVFKAIEELEMKSSQATVGMDPNFS